MIFGFYFFYLFVCFNPMYCNAVVQCFCTYTVNLIAVIMMMNQCKVTSNYITSTHFNWTTDSYHVQLFQQTSEKV